MATRVKLDEMVKIGEPASWDRCKRCDFLILEAAITSKLPMAFSKPQKTATNRAGNIG
jgi:hypothetical protein